MFEFSARNGAASQHCSSLDCFCVTSCSLDISSNTGRHQQTRQQSKWHFLCWWEKERQGDRSLHRLTLDPPAEDKPPQRRACQVSWGWTERRLLITCSVTPRQTRGIIFITRAVLFFCFFFWSRSNIHSQFGIMVWWWSMDLISEYGEPQKWRWKNSTIWQ